MFRERIFDDVKIRMREGETSDVSDRRHIHDDEICDSVILCDLKHNGKRGRKEEGIGERR